VARHWIKPDQPPPDLTVIATDRAEPDRAIGEDYVRSDHPHLYVRPLQAGAVIGPFVLPGRTPCLGCLDRVRRDADPAWPGLLAQLCRLPVPVLPMLAAWAASTAVVQIASWAADGEPGTAGSTLELTSTDYQLRARPWPMHPSCGCWWAA
jgi:bacteriocin biosynthesis cyclodehydratase domain-containing protein